MQLSIRPRRERLGLSQRDLAERCNVNQTAISQWERGSSLPSCDKLPLIAAALRCSIDDLYAEASVNTRPQYQ